MKAAEKEMSSNFTSWSNGFFSSCCSFDFALLLDYFERDYWTKAANTSTSLKTLVVKPYGHNLVEFEFLLLLMISCKSAAVFEESKNGCFHDLKHFFRQL